MSSNQQRRDDTRTESDSMGSMQVPADACYGAQTARAVENFPISGWRFSRAFIRALGLIKQQAALTNAELEQLPDAMAKVIARAAGEVASGQLDDQFVVDIFQTGSGTSTNMNANEVIAHRAGQMQGAPSDPIHPNDHVNLGQSSNDVMPTALHLAALQRIQDALAPALGELHQALADKARAFDDILKVGRTHLQDAMPIRLGQVFSGYASQVAYGLERLESAAAGLAELPLGGTAVGTGINTHPEFATRVIEHLTRETGLTLRRARNPFAAQAARDACVDLSGALKTISVSLIKIANDLRLLGAGPRAGLGELKLPAVQPGSSIMPGKVNPVMCEMILQVGVQVIGHDTAITWGGAWGQFELNAMIPLIAHNLLQSIELLSQASRTFARRCIEGLEADEAKCRERLEQNLALATALVPEIGYDRAAALAKEALQSGRTVREVAREKAGLPEDRLNALLDARRLTEGGG